MSIASLLSIKVTSPITHMVSSAVRGVAGSLLAIWLFHDIVTRYFSRVKIICSPYRKLYSPTFSGRAVSIAVILSGSIYYTWVKHQESLPAYERVKMEDVESASEHKPK
jgi:solute carrier family 35 (GDP-fucose transporter), member C1